jgi:flavin reductase (DIM6/NTAB) family NADH-FMN oxidoreductase RutF
MPTRRQMTRREAIRALASTAPVLAGVQALGAAQGGAPSTRTLKRHGPTGRLVFTAEELLERPRVPGIDRTVFYFHFRPARPADIVVTRDPDTGEVDFTPQTFGPLTDHPLTICLHTNRSASPHSTRNLGQVGAEAVVALPGPDLVRQTWICAVPMPRGICEGEAAGLTLLPSHVVSVPGIAECPVNLECRVEFVRQQYSHNAVFLKVVGASVEEELLRMDRLDIIRRGPTYEVDDGTNKWGGAVERLGTNHELLECPGFPVGPKAGPEAGAAAWIRDLHEAGHLSKAECDQVLTWLTALEELPAAPSHEARQTLQQRLTRVFELAAWEEWDSLHMHLSRRSEL